MAVTFYWVGCSDGKHIAAAVDALWNAVMSKAGRLRNPYVEAIARAEFKDRLEVAARGDLEPITQVKSIDEYPHIDMFEIRWSGISLRERRAVGEQPTSVEAEVRLYYVELNEIDRCVLGCHVHEKSLLGTPREIRERQNQEIDQAVLVYGAGYTDRWGVPELCSK